jgi:hypothetical protein
VVAHCRCPPSPVTGVSFKTDPRERSWYVVCYKLESLCAGVKEKQRNSVPKSSPRGAHSAVARLQFRREKTQSVAERARIEPKGGRRDSRPAQHACLRRTGDSRIASRSVHSLPAPSHVLSDYTGPEVSCGSCCVVLYWYTSCSSSNLPSSEYAGQDHSVKSGRPSSVGMCDPNSKGFSLIDPNQPRCAEFFRGGETPEPLHPDHIRVKRPVCPQVVF